VDGNLLDPTFVTSAVLLGSIPSSLQFMVYMMDLDIRILKYIYDRKPIADWSLEDDKKW